MFGDIFGGVRLGFVDRPAWDLWPTVSLHSVLCMDRGGVNRKNVPLADPWGGISVGGGGVGFFGKAVNREAAVNIVDGIALLDISVGCCRPVRGNAERYQFALRRRFAAASLPT